MKEYIGTIENIPAQVCVCKVAEKDVTIVAISKEHVVIRLSEKPGKEKLSLEFSCFFWDEDEYVHFGPFEGTLAGCVQKEYWIEVIVEISAPEYVLMVERVQKQLTEYIYEKVNSYDNSFSKKLVGYPADYDSEFSTSYLEWKQYIEKKYDIETLLKKAASSGFELALSLENPLQWKKYLNDDIGFPFSRLYIGNAFCHILHPTNDEIVRILNKAKADDTAITVVLTYLREELIEQQTAYFETVYNWSLDNSFQIEFEINDLGWMEILSGKGIDFSFGRLINKRRKDPRYKYKNKIDAHGRSLGENSLNDRAFLSKLMEYGVSRAEAESCGYEMEIPDISTSLHIPFYQTNTSQMCPLYALWKNSDRGQQEFVKSCQLPCLDNKLLYPNHLAMVGRYNSIFAIDTWLAGNIDILDKYKACGVDRIVWNFFEE